MSKYDDIRPYHDDEVKAAIDALLLNQEFLDFLGKYHSPKLSQYIAPLLRFVSRSVLKRALGNVNSVAEFQEVVSYYAKKLVSETMTEFVFDGVEGLDPSKSYLFVGNHRDIAGDSMLVDYALWLSKHETVRIAVGDNLIQKDFATSLMKLNKSFFIRRSEEGAKKVYAALLQSSQYIHDSIESGNSVWIAQAEGRAKDGMDETDPAIIKMFALAKRKMPLKDIVESLRIVPVAISYEFDPCDYLKAKELTSIQQQGSYKKPAGEDLLSLVKGLGDYKGKVHLRFGTPLEGEFESPEEVANAIDHQLLERYQLFQVNYWALQKLAESGDGGYQETWEALRSSVEFGDMSFVQQRYETCPESHRMKWLEMYANPVVNKYRSKSSTLTPI